MSFQEQINLLSHNPDVFPTALRRGFQAVLSGHTHGGQVNVEILHQNINPARFRTPYTSGLYQLGEADEAQASCFVTNGIGTIDSSGWERLPRSRCCACGGLDLALSHTERHSWQQGGSGRGPQRRARQVRSRRLLWRSLRLRAGFQLRDRLGPRQPGGRDSRQSRSRVPASTRSTSSPTLPGLPPSGPWNI